jgi:UPF0716 protein FxsA
MFALALILLFLWPVAELFVIIQVAEAIGVLLTLALLIAGWPIGRWAIRAQGRTAWRRMAIAVNAGRVPAREVLDGTLMVIGGLLLMIPGFISDAVGIVLLLPAGRAPFRWLLARNFGSSIVTQTVRFTSRGREYDVDSTATDLDRPQLPR